MPFDMVNGIRSWILPHREIGEKLEDAASTTIEGTPTGNDRRKLKVLAPP
jgi:hypothetical protein